MRDKIIALLERHCGTIRAEAIEIDACFRSFGTVTQGDHIEKTIYLVHKIKGSSGSLGFLALSNAAHTLEYALRDLDEQPDRAQAFDKIAPLCTALQRVVVFFWRHGFHFFRHDSRYRWGRLHREPLRSRLP